MRYRDVIKKIAFASFLLTLCSCVGDGRKQDHSSGVRAIPSMQDEANTVTHIEHDRESNEFVLWYYWIFCVKSKEDPSDKFLLIPMSSGGLQISIDDAMSYGAAVKSKEALMKELEKLPTNVGVMIGTDSFAKELFYDEPNRSITGFDKEEASTIIDFIRSHGPTFQILE
jgi:hypothetical protein